MMKKYTQQSGFTLIETLIAILILSLAIGALLTLTAGGFFGIRYAKNDIVASNLLQESLEYVRNSRDNAAQSDSGTSWGIWQSRYAACASDDGCMINPYADTDGGKVQACSGDCDQLKYFPDAGFYGYNDTDIFNTTGGQGFATSFVRTVHMTEIAPTGVNVDPQLLVTATMEWMNGTNKKSTTQSIVLTRWNLQ